MAGILSEHEHQAVLSIQSLLSRAKNPCLCFSGGKKSLVLLHMVKQLAPAHIAIIHIDTGAEFPAVRAFVQKMKKLWNLNLIMEISRDMKDSDHQNREFCCKEFIHKPLKKIIKSGKFDGVLVGEISESHSDLSGFLGTGPDSDMLLAQPLISFDTRDIWEYIRSHNLPCCSLYEKGYSTIDCEPCSLVDTHRRNESIVSDEEELIKEKLKKLGYL